MCCSIRWSMKQCMTLWHSQRGSWGCRWARDCGLWRTKWMDGTRPSPTMDPWWALCQSTMCKGQLPAAPLPSPPLSPLNSSLFFNLMIWYYVNISCDDSRVFPLMVIWFWCHHDGTNTMMTWRSCYISVYSHVTYTSWKVANWSPMDISIARKSCRIVL